MAATRTIEQDIERIEAILPTLLTYLGSHVADLPEETQRALRKLKLGPKLTSSGLEPVSAIVDWLYYARHLARGYLRGEIGPSEKTKLTKRQ